MLHVRAPPARVPGQSLAILSALKRSCIRIRSSQRRFARSRADLPAPQSQRSGAPRATVMRRSTSQG